MGIYLHDVISISEYSSYAIHWTIAPRSIWRILACSYCRERHVSLSDKLSLHASRFKTWSLGYYASNTFSRIPCAGCFLPHDIPQREIKSCLDRDTIKRSSFDGFTVVIIPINRVRSFSLGLNYELKCHLRTSSRGAVFESYYIQVRR